MSDEPNIPGNPSMGGPAEGEQNVPMARPSGTADENAAGAGGFGPRPIFEVADDRCPKCGTVMQTTDVVCLKCGYDQRANVVREVETGVEEVAAAVVETAKEFVVPGRFSPKVLGIVGGVLTVGAMVAAGVFAPTGAKSMVVVGLIVLTLYQIVLHTVTGVTAVAIAAKLEGEKFGRGDYAVGRMFVAFALFQLLSLIQLPIWPWASTILMWGLGAAAYFGTVMLLFKKDRATAVLIALAHFVLWMLLNAGMMLSGLVSAGLAAAPVK